MVGEPRGTDRFRDGSRMGQRGSVEEVEKWVALFVREVCFMLYSMEKAVFYRWNIGI